jgi:hypothetical protein
MIWDGVTKAKRPTGWKSLHGWHLFCISDDADDVCHLTKTWLLKHLNVSGRFNFPVRFCDSINLNDMCNSELDLAYSNRAFHNCAVNSMECLHTLDFINAKVFA